jgi:H+/Cl- antiporter ClcA
MKIKKLQLTESTILFFSIIKWVFLATIAGVVVGSATTVFLKMLSWGTGITRGSGYWYLLVPAGMGVSALMVHYLAPEAKGHGTEKVIEAVHLHSGKIPLKVVPVKLLATVITLACGGSAGKEGPCAQIGAGLTSSLSSLFQFNERDRKKLVICGISAGFAAVFGTPIAGAIFGVEVLFVGALLYDVLLPSLVAGITAYQTASYFGIQYFQHTISISGNVSEGMLLNVMGSGVFFGVCSIMIILMLKIAAAIAGKIKLWSPVKALAGGLLLAALAFFFSKKYLGLGTESIEENLRGEGTDKFGFILKPLFTSITLSFGGSGGIITPIFFTGSAAGCFWAHVMGYDPSFFAAIGFVSVLAGAANTPIAASIMSMEMFGPSIAPYAAVACVISFLMTGHRSVYPSQILSISKSSSLSVETGKNISSVPFKMKQPGKAIAVLNRIMKKRNSRKTPV